MKTLTKTFARRVISALLVTIMVFSLGITSIVSTSAAEVELAETSSYVRGGRIYFDNTNSGWTDGYIYFVVGHDNDGGYTKFYTMTKIKNTNLYYVNIDESTDKWEDSEFYCVIGDNTSWGNGKFIITEKYKDITHYTALKWTYDFDYGSVYLLTPDSSSNNCPLTIDYQVNGMQDLNHQQKIYAYGANNGSSTYSKNSAAGTVTASGYYLNDDNNNGKVISAKESGELKTSSTNPIDYKFARGSTLTLKATPATGYEFVGWSTSASSADVGTRTNATFTYSVQESGKTYYALFKKAASLSDLEVDVEGTHQIVNEPVTLNVSYNATNVTNSAVELYLGSTKVNDAVYNSTNKTITFTPTTTGSQTYTVKVSGTNVTAITKDVTVNVLPVLNVGINGTPTSQYVGENVTVYVLSSTALEYGTDITYSLFCNGTFVGSNGTGEFTVTQDVADTYEYYGKVSVAGYDAETTENLTLTFNPKTFSIDTFTSSVGDTIDENRDFTLTATVKFATEGEEVRYYLTFPDGTVVDNTEGVFGIRSKNLVDGVTSEVVTYKIYATCNGETTAVKELQMTIKEDTGTYPIKLLFKCSTVKGYQPQIKVNGVDCELEEETKIEKSDVTGHGVSEYVWYSFYTQQDATYNQQINIEFKANRSAYYNVTYTLEVGSDDHTSVNGVDYYYLAIENLNAGRNAEVFNLSHWPEAERNWTESAVNMVFTEGKDVLPVELNKNEIATTSFTYRFANIGDANLDGDVNVKDATFVQKTVAGMTRTDSLVDFACDYNYDGRISIQDATAIQKQIAGL